MKIAILIRGFHYLEKDRFGYSLDARLNIENLMSNVVEPVRRLYPDHLVVLSTYPSNHLDEIVERIGPDHTIVNDPASSSQINTYQAGIEYIFNNNKDIGAIICLRFDLEFKISIDQWNIVIDDRVIYFPWREYAYAWRDHRRVGDAIHILGRDGIHPFHRAMSMCGLAQRKDLHLMYYFLRPMHKHISFICQGHWDSNTMFGNAECDNPLYRISNRPRLPEVAPYLNMIFNELKTE